MGRELTTDSQTRHAIFRTPWRFLILAAVFHVVDGVLVRLPLFSANVDAIAGVVAIDLTFGLTAAWWFMVVRSGNAVARSVLPVVAASIAGATATLPSGHRGLLAGFRLAAVPLELIAILGVAVAVRRTSRALAAAGAERDVPERIRVVLGDAVPSRVAAVVATELAMFYYALCAWRRKPFVPLGSRGFSYHRKNGYAALMFTVLGLALVELLVADLLLRSRHPHIANTVLAFDLFGVVWLLGFIRAIQLRPILLSSEVIGVRIGLQWFVDIPRESIESFVYGRIVVAPRGTPEWLRGLPSPNTLLTLRAPLFAEGPYGIRRAVRFIALSVDDLVAFKGAVADKQDASARPYLGW